MKQIDYLLAEAIRKNILPVTGQCNLSCVFCSHRYNPPEALVYDLPSLPVEQIKSLTAGLDPSAKIVMGESVTRLREGEPFSHPHIREILQTIRESFPATPLQITTNGTLLKPALLQYLAAMKPLELVISLNSITKKGRRLLMGDKNASRVIEVIEGIAEKDIPFHGSVVAMPNLVGRDDLEETLRFLESKGAQTIRLFIPGFTRYTPDNLIISDAELKKLRLFIQHMQESLTCPLLPEPPEIKDLNPVTEGVIKNSPAREAGLKRNDVIVSVEGEIPRCRVEAFNMIYRKKDPLVEIKRKGHSLEKKISKGKNHTSGITMHYDLAPGDLETVQNHLKTGKRVLLLTSHAAAPLWEALHRKIDGGNLKIAAVTSHFWGGSICSAGLLTVEDFRRELQQLPRKYSPEIVMLPPQAFDEQGLDITGHSYLELLDMLPGNARQGKGLVV